MNAGKRHNRKNGEGCCATPIKGATNQPSMTSNIPHIANAVAMQPKGAGLAGIRGAVNKPKP